MIPKKIHYCWFGEKPKSKEVLAFIETWKQVMPDYVIKEWNEDNFDIKNSCNYVREAYNEKKFAFVSDFVRIYALYNEGGIYLDTDVEVLKSYNPLLTFKAFFGLEDKDRVATCVIGGEKEYPLFKMILDYYSSRHFIIENKKLDLTPNPVIISKIIEDTYGMVSSNFTFYDEFYIAPIDFFSPKSFVTNKIITTDRTYSIHHFEGSWIPLWKKLLLRVWVPFSVRFPKIATKIKEYGLL